MPSTLFRDAAVFDGVHDSLRPGMNVLVQGNTITAVSSGDIDIPSRTHVVDLDGRTLMPGLIDAHFHAALSEETSSAPAEVIRSSLSRALTFGFTTLRDAGGASPSLRLPIQTRLGQGPPVVGATQVAMRDSRFHPPVIQIKQGQTVTWSFNDGGATHNVKGTGWGSGDQASGTSQHTFTAPGSYRYSCTLHLGMNGRVDVGPGATP